MAHDFIGKVTRQEKRSGVTLKARITSPKGNVSKYQSFKCSIKEAGLSDGQAVIAVLNEIVSNLETKGINNLSTNITTDMPTVDSRYENMSINYQITGDAREYISGSPNPGKILKRPVYQSNIAVGELTITVTKGTQSASHAMQIGVAPYTKNDLETYISEYLVWNTIKGENQEEDAERIKDGRVNIWSSLNLVNEIPQNQMTATPISVEWTITDEYRTATSSAENRILDNGSIQRDTYYNYNKIRINDAYSNIRTLFEIVNNGDTKIARAGSGFLMRVGGLSLRAVASLNDEQIKVRDFTNLATLSSVLTNEQVKSYLVDVFNEKKSTWFGASDINHPGTVFVPSIGKVSGITQVQTIQYGSTDETIFQIVANTNYISDTLTANKNNLTDSVGISLNVDSNTFSALIYDITNLSSTDENKEIDALSVDTVYPTTYNSSGWQSSDPNVILDFQTNTKPDVTDILIKVPYGISGYPGPTTVFTTGFKFSVTAAPTPSSGGSSTPGS